MQVVILLIFELKNMKAPIGYTGLRISLASLLALILSMSSMQANAMMMEYWDVDGTGWSLDDGPIGGFLDVTGNLGTPGFLAGPEYGLGSGDFQDNFGFTPGTAHSASFKLWLKAGPVCEVAIDTDDSCGEGAVVIFDLGSFGAEGGSQLGALGTSSYAFGDFSITGSLFADVNELGILSWDAFGEGGYIEAVALMVTAYEKDAAVPTPSVLGLFAIGLLGLGFIRRKKNQS